METKDWLLVLGPLVGVLIGGVIATVAKLIELGHTSVRDDRRLFLNKLETLHAEVAGFISLFGQRIISNKLAALKPNDSMVFEASRLADERVLEATARISAMVRLYAPEVQTFWSLVANLNTEYNQKLLDGTETHDLTGPHGLLRKVASTSALVLSGIESKVEVLGLLRIHSKSSFSENLALSISKFADGFASSNQKQTEELKIIGAEMRKKQDRLQAELDSDPQK